MLIPLGVVIYISMGGLKVRDKLTILVVLVIRAAAAAAAAGCSRVHTNCLTIRKQMKHPLTWHHRCMLQAAFISSYLHSSLIFAVALVFSYTVYTSADDPIGTIDNVWRNLNIRSEVCLVGKFTWCRGALV